MDGRVGWLYGREGRVALSRRGRRRKERQYVDVHHIRLQLIVLIVLLEECSVSKSPGCKFVLFSKTTKILT